MYKNHLHIIEMSFVVEQQWEKNIIYESRKGSFPKLQTMRVSFILNQKYTNLKLWEKNSHLNEKKDSIHGAIKNFNHDRVDPWKRRSQMKKDDPFLLSLYLYLHLKNSFATYSKIIIIFYVFFLKTH